MPEFPPEARARGVLIRDILPPGLRYEVDSARIESEDFNGNQVLDPGEDLNGNGRIDTDVAYEPMIEAGPEVGENSPDLGLRRPSISA